MKTYIKIPPINHERFLSKVKIEQSGCWTWQASKMKTGYGKFSTNNGWLLAHRVSFSIFNNVEFDNLLIDHMCRNRSCVNPDHLRAVTFKQNTTENSTSVAAVNKIKTHCLRGHKYDEQNTVIRKNGRECRACSNSNARRLGKEKRKAAALIPKEVRTHCKNGHELLIVGMKLVGGFLSCRQCYKNRAQRYREKKKLRSKSSMHCM